MKYLLLICADETMQLSPAESAAMESDTESWVTEMDGRGVRLQGERLRPVLPEPVEAELDRGMRLADRVELVLEALEHVAGAKERQLGRRDRVHLRELFGELERQRFAALGELRPGDDPPADRLAADALGCERLASAELAEVAVGARHAHARSVGGLEHAVFVLERERVRMDDAPGGTADEQL